MNKKGFTLIELLAIIVILAIIAAITIPQITKIIEKTRQDTAEISAMGYMDALEKQMMVQSQNDEEFTLDGEYIIENGNLKKIQNNMI